MLIYSKTNCVHNLFTSPGGKCEWNELDKDRIKVTATQLNLNDRHWKGFVFKNEFAANIQDKILLLIR